jgi:hypothetical protein
MEFLSCKTSLNSPLNKLLCSPGLALILRFSPEHVPAAKPYSPLELAQDQFLNAAFSTSTAAPPSLGDTSHSHWTYSYLAASARSNRPLTSLNSSPTPEFLLSCPAVCCRPSSGWHLHHCPNWTNQRNPTLHLSSHQSTRSKLPL